MALVAESRVESTVLEKFYSDVQKSIVDPVHVASLLRQEGVVAESLIDEISPANRFTRSERTASILRHVEGAVRVDQQSFWAFIAVLEQSGPPACNVAQQMRNAVKLHKLAAEKKKGKSDTEGDLFVSEVYQTDFDGIKRKFLSLHLRISKILANNGCVTLENLKELLAFYSELKGPLQAAETITSVMDIVQQHSSVINCSYLQHIAEHFNLPDVSKEIDAYSNLVDEFCQQKITQHSYVKSFMAEQQNHILSTQTLTLKLEWKPADDKTLADIQSLIRKAFKSLSDHVHVVVIKEGSVTVICYAPHYIMGTLVQMAKESKSMLLENSVSYLSIGYTVVLDSTDQETKIRDLTQENTALQLRLTALQGQLQLSEEVVSQFIEPVLPKFRSTEELQSQSPLRKKVKLEPALYQSKSESMLIESELPSLGTTEELQSQSPLRKKLKLEPALYQSKSESMLIESELPKFTSLGTTEELSSQSPLLEKSKVIHDKPVLYQSKSDEMVSMLMETEPGSTTLPAFTSHQSTEKVKRLQRVKMEEEMKGYLELGLSHSKVVLIGLTPDGIKYLMEHQMIEGIEDCMDVTPEQQEAIFQGLRSNTSLRELDISFTLSPVNMSALSASLTINNTLQSLRLRCCLDDHAIELLSALRVNRSLHTLELSCTVTDTGAQHLATMLTANTTLKELDLSSLTISDTGILHLSEALKHNSSVKKLSFRYNKHITNTGAVALSKMLLVNKSLKNLTLYGTSVGEEGAAALMESLLHNQVLTRLVLPRKLRTYCKQHKLYARVKDKINL